MGYAFFDRGFATHMGKREARRDAMSTVLKMLNMAKKDPRTISGTAAYLMLDSISKHAPYLAASVWFEKSKEKDAIMFFKEWDKAAKEFAETHPLKQRAKRKSKSQKE